MSHKLSHSNILPFIVAGKAIFTIKNSSTGGRFTYKVVCPPDKKPEEASIFFVKLLTGPDNESSYKYIGYIKIWNGSPCFYYGTKSKIGNEAPGVVAFEFVFNQILAAGRVSNVLEVWHEGKCCRCGRTLTVPESIESGIGPECARIVHKHAA